MEKSSLQDEYINSDENESKSSQNNPKRRLKVSRKGKNKECLYNIFNYNHLIDIPNKVKVTYKYKGNFYFKVEFNQRNDGIIADPKIFSFKFLKMFYPQFLVEVLESSVNNIIHRR